MEYEDMSGGNRSKWEFEYTAKVLAEGARKQMDFRRERVAQWTAAKDKAMTEVRESGIEVSESMAESFANYGQTTAMGPKVMVRADLQSKLTECHGKIRQHAQAAAEYDGWVQFLEANPEARVKLTQADWLYFFGKR